MTDDHDIQLSVVTAAYDEAANLPRLIQEIDAALKHIPGVHEIIIVDDGSDDATPDVCGQLLDQYPLLRVRRLAHRSGQTAAIDAGFRIARGTYVAMLDADLQNDPADVPRLLDMLITGPYDLVSGWRSRRQDPWIRRLSSRIANDIRNRLTHESIHDSACGLKVFRRACLAQIKLYTGMHRFLPTLFRMEGFRVVEVPVNHRPRIAGIAKYGIRNRAVRGLRDTLAVRWMHSRALRYEVEEERRSSHA
ncbi:MAG TPA: glycosyltransferase family 2 protein [Sedimentisphaerales bacterium]|jgi:glycosyltransferase involved in cell wall biosynthesis|nr:glycosyltransferase family 2 protein [Sedimentisphaerales bacterium]HOH66732.1 glycosyltransferase family 2 protein [Sedimentisphaerales bacterium]